MAGTSRPSQFVALVGLSLAAALSGCATAPGRVEPNPAPEGSAEERGPGVRIWTADDPGSLSRVRPVIRLEDDAYVVVVNVGLDGYANVVFPESPEDDGFMRGGRTYRLPSFFPGFASHFYRSQYRRFYNATSAYDDIYDRYAGYVFVIASWRPMHFQLAEALGLWDNYRLAVHERQLDPYVVMHDYAERFVPGRRDYTARYARYAAFGGGYARSSFASCTFYNPALGYVPWWVFQSVAGGAWVPVFGLGYRGSHCGYNFGLALNTYGPIVRGPIATPPPPVRPTPQPVDSAAPPPRTRRLRNPVAPGDSAERKSTPRGRRGEAEDETIIDVTRETRALARRRGRDAERGEAWSRGERGYEPASRWERSERSRPSQRAAERYDDQRGERAARAERETRPRSESPRDEGRASEPRRPPAERAPAPSRPERSEPRSEPRQETRPQPTRSEPASRPEPRSEKPAKPADPR